MADTTDYKALYEQQLKKNKKLKEENESELGISYKALYEQQQQETDIEHQRYLETAEKYSDRLWEVCQELDIENDDTSENIIEAIKKLKEQNDELEDEVLGCRDSYTLERESPYLRFRGEDYEDEDGNPLKPTDVITRKFWYENMIESLGGTDRFEPYEDDIKLRDIFDKVLTYREQRDELKEENKKLKEKVIYVEELEEQVTELEESKELLGEEYKKNKIEIVDLKKRIEALL